jgi:hypothetical protein
VQGHVIIRTFEGERTGLAALSTVNVVLTAMAGDNTYRFRDVGADLVRIEPDGTAILMIMAVIDSRDLEVWASETRRKTGRAS